MGNEPMTRASGAPEVEQQAPEPDLGALAPEHYSPEGIHPHSKTSPTYYQPYQAGSPNAANLGPSKYLWRAVAVIVLCLILIAIALGVGLGLGLRKRDAPSTADTATLPDATPTSTVASSSVASVLSITTSATPVPSNKGILDDTSLAAVTSFDGNRHVFFQDTNGSIRHTVYAQSAGSWATAPDLVSISSSPPRNHTPLSAIPISLGPSAGEIHLFYTTTDGFLAATLYQLGNVIAGNPKPINNSLAVASDSRALSITLVPQSQNGTTAEAILLFESPYGNITTLRGYFTATDTSVQWVWHNISETISSAFDGADTWLSPPTAIQCDCFGLPDDNRITFTFFNFNALSNSSASPLYSIQWQDWTGLVPDADSAPYIYPEQLLPNLDPIPNNSTAAIQGDDVISFIGPGGNGGGTAYVQNQRLTFNYFGGDSNVPSLTTPYPFARLAWSNDTTTGGTYIYHQLSDSTLVEDAYFVAGGWHTTNISLNFAT